VEDGTSRQRWSDGPWEEPYGYSRVLRVGRHVHVSGTTATRPDGTVIAPDDAHTQTEAIIERIAQALEQVGAGLDDVVRTRIYAVEGVEPAEVLDVHGRAFRRARPAAAFVVVRGLLAPGMLVEIEADAFVGGGCGAAPPG
jgi:enamine deaminase RidA (YjgF/YER057c/UK114 family)